MIRPWKRMRTVKGKRIKDRKYTIKYRLLDGSWKMETAYQDKEASEVLLADRIRAVERGEVGLADEFKELRGMPLSQHLAAFLATIRAGGATERYVKKMETRLNYAFEAMKANRAADLTIERAERFILHLRDRKKALATVNHYTSALKEFSHWGFARRRWPVDGLGGLRRVNAQQDLQRRRRAISPKEFAELIAAARTRAVTEYVRTHPAADEAKRAELGYQGESRAVAYQLAGLAGLRYNEVKTLVWADVDFDRAPARITIRARNAKSKREDVIPTSDSLAAALLAWHDAEKARLGRAPKPEERVVHVGSRFRDSFKSDLKAAGIAEKDAAGLYFDFHALRHSFASWLAQKGAHPKVAQELLRHTDVRLTLKAYTHTTREQQLTALASLPKLENCAPNVTTDVTNDVTTGVGGSSQGEAEGVEACQEAESADSSDIREDRQKETGADRLGQPLSGGGGGGNRTPVPKQRARSFYVRRLPIGSRLGGLR